MGIVVQKFGGSSLRGLNNSSKILSRIRECIDDGDDPVVVVSAIGRRGDPYATDTLIEQLEQISGRIDPKKKDLMMSCGETISAALVSHLLEVNNMPAEPLTGFQAGILTDNNFNSAEIIDIDTSNIKKLIGEGKIAVVTGFQGITRDGEITTLGRGGSDITAISLGGYLNAKRVDIFTDVPGVALIDPNIVPYTDYIKSISYDDMYELASNGAKVLHPKSVEIAKKFNIMVRVTSTFEKVPGTLVTNEYSRERIIGIAVVNDRLYYTFKIYYCKEYKISVLENIKAFLQKNYKNILGVKFNNHCITIRTNTKDVFAFSRKLYDALIRQ